MKTYKIPVAWEMYGYMYIETTSLEKAIEDAYDFMPLPDGNYVEGSFEVDHEVIPEDYDGED